MKKAFSSIFPARERREREMSSGEGGGRRLVAGNGAQAIQEWTLAVVAA